jgi:type IV pilus assembly protein PilE
MRGKGGVTLIEVMVVVAIVGLLAAIAIPAYNDYVTRSRRSDAFTALETVRAAQEMYRAEKGFYSAAFVDGGVNVLAGCSAGMAGDNYSIAVARSSATAYTVTATALASGKQASDKYSQFRENQNGIQEYYDTSWHAETDADGKKWQDLR